MPKQVVAKDGDTLCGLAIRHGFLNCDPLRAEGANAALLNRPLQAGDKVTIPDLRERKAKAAVDGTHKYKLERLPEPKIRFVHGSQNKPFDRDPTLAFLEISNFRTDRGGPTAANPFPNGFGFHADGHADPDAFKIELVSPDGGNPVKVKLEALQPVYKPDGSVGSHQPFTGANAAGRSLDVDCELVGASTKTMFRSRYLRLVTDTADQGAAATQALLVTDIADGNGGANDQMEILDQHVRATYELPKCKAASNKCAVRAEAPVGHDRKRIRMAVTIFNATIGGGPIGGTTAQMVRRRANKWFRRAWAQANCSVRLVSAPVTVDPPGADMIAISDPNGTPAAGLDGSGNQSTVSFKIDRPPVPLLGNILPAHTITVNLTPGRTPTQVCNDIAAALPAGFAGTVHTNARALNQAIPGADIIIRRNDGGRVAIRQEATTDLALTIQVARPNVANVNVVAATFNALIVWTPESRRLSRVSGQDSQLDVFVVGSIPGARGVAMVPASDLAAPFRAPIRCRNAVFMRAAQMSIGDNDPFTFPHEAGHVVNDAFHADPADPNGPQEMMTGAGTSVANAIGASKRISDMPVQVRYAKYDPAQTNPGDTHTVAIVPVGRMRTKGAHLMENW